MVARDPTDFQARRLQRRLDDLERTNPTDIPATSFQPPPPHPPGSSAALAHAAAVAAAKKKQSPNVRRALYGKKSHRDWLEELPGAAGGVAGPGVSVTTAAAAAAAAAATTAGAQGVSSRGIPPYVTAAAPPPATPPRQLCASCGYIGKYRCARCAEWSCSAECMGVHERDGGCGVSV